MKRIRHSEAGDAGGALCLRGLFLGICLLVLCAGFSQPELHDRHPGLKAPVVTGKLLKPQKNPYDLGDLRGLRGLLASGSVLFASVFHAAFARFDRKQNPHLWSGVTFGHQRSPPLYV